MLELNNWKEFLDPREYYPKRTKKAVQGKYSEDYRLFGQVKC